MRKKIVTFLMATALVLLCACENVIDVSVAPQDPNASQETNISGTNDSQEPDSNTVNEGEQNQVCDRWADSGSFKMYTSEEDSFDFYFDYSIPQIVDDTEDAKAINDSIASLFEDMHNTMQRASKEGEITVEEFEDTEWFQTNYDCYWNESIASIVIYSTGYFDSETEYNVYNYDFATGKQVSNEELFALKDTNSDKFVEDLRRAAVYSLDREMQDFFKSEMPLVEDEICYADVMDEDVQLMYGDYLQARAKTINQDNINEKVPVYLDENGELQAITHLYNMSMYGEVTNVLSPKAWVNNDVKAWSGDILDVLSKDDGMYLIIYREGWSDEVHDEFPTFEFAKEYKIDGLYKNYIDARISWVGNGKQPYILLLSDDGTISYVDVWEGIASGYFCAVEPLWGLENIKAFNDDLEYRIIAETNDGKLVDVEDSLYMMVYCRYVDFEKRMLNLGNVESYFATVNHEVSGQAVEYKEMIGFTKDQYHLFERKSLRTDDNEGDSELGYITFNGMNEKGMVFYFSLVGEEGEVRGSMAINVCSFWDNDSSDFVDEAEVFWLSGLDIFESKGNGVMLKGSVE